MSCPLKCWSSEPVEDSQEHLLDCSKIKEKFITNHVISEPICYDDILGKDVKKQKELAVLFTKLLKIKKELITDEPVILDPCMRGVNHLCNRNAIFTPVSVVCLSGNK